AERIDRLLKESHIDSDIAQMYGKYMMNGLDTMFPKLAHGTYPTVKLPGIEGKPLEKQQPAPGDTKKQEDAKPGVPAKAPIKGGFEGKGGGLEGKQPGTAEATQVAWQKEDAPWTSAPKDIQEKFKGDYELFNPFAKGTQPDKKAVVGDFGG